MSSVGLYNCTVPYSVSTSPVGLSEETLQTRFGCEFLKRLQPHERASITEYIQSNPPPTQEEVQEMKTGNSTLPFQNDANWPKKILHALILQQIDESIAARLFLLESCWKEDPNFQVHQLSQQANLGGELRGLPWIDPSFWRALDRELEQLPPEERVFYTIARPDLTMEECAQLGEKLPFSYVLSHNQEWRVGYHRSSGRRTGPDGRDSMASTCLTARYESA